MITITAQIPACAIKSKSGKIFNYAAYEKEYAFPCVVFTIKKGL